MAIVNLIMPKMGESIHEATIISWQKRIGEAVEIEEPVLDVATDKVDSDVPSPANGILIEILASEGEVVQVGQIIAKIQTEKSSTTPNPAVPEPSQAIDVPPTLTESPARIVREEIPSAPIKPEVHSAQSGGLQTAVLSTDGERFYSPLVRNIARAEGISMEELQSIAGTGGEGRITKHDLRKYIERRGQVKVSTIQSPIVPPITESKRVPTQTREVSAQPSRPADTSLTPPAPGKNTGEEIIEMDRQRKLIAAHMKHSQDVSATVTSFVEADATHLVHWRDRNKAAFAEKYGEKLTYTPLFVEATIQALGDYPEINASLEGEQLIQKRHLNIGIATAMQNGNLIVPIIKDAGKMNLQGLTAQLNDLTSRARANNLKPDEVQDGTFTITNIGTYGNIMGTPIINQPQLAILALGAIKKKPVIHETPHGDTIAIRHMMYLSLSFDHRVIDGYLGGVFLNRIAHYIEAFDPSRAL